MALRLTELEVQAFRGATTKTRVEFDAAKPLIVMFGPNGSGKSTLVDAIDFIGNECVGSLQDRAGASNRQIPAIGRKPPDVKVMLSTTGGRWWGELNRSKPQVSPAGAKPRIEILRRARLLKLVEAAPGKRFEALAQFISIPEIQAAEVQLSRAFRNLTTAAQSAEARSVDVQGQLVGLWQENGQPRGSWRRWAVGMSASNTEDVDAEVQSLHQVIAAIEAFQVRASDHQAARESLDTARKAREELAEQHERMQETWSTETTRLVQTLEAAAGLLDEWTQSNCPLCKQPIDAAAVRVEVKQSLESMRAMRDANQRAQAANEAVAAAEQHVNSASNALLSVAQQLLKVVAASQAVVVSEEDAKQAARFEEAMCDLDTMLPLCCRIAERHRELDDRRSARQREQNQLRTIKSCLATFLDAERDIEASEQMSARFYSALNVVREQRIRFVQDVLDSVSNDAARMYGAIHPHEPVKAGRLTLDPNKRASLLQVADFGDQTDVSPQAYFSDSHLDTLAFCYWLALAKREDALNTVAVIDDVFSAVDLNHAARIAELLHNESTQFGQIAILTHDESWVRAFADRDEIAADTQFIELQPWSLEQGVSWKSWSGVDSRSASDVSTESRPQEPQQHAPPQRRSLTQPESAEASLVSARECGSRLGKTLRQLCEAYEQPLSGPRERTLGDLVTSTAKLGQLLHVQRVDGGSQPQPPVRLREAFSRLQSISPILGATGRDLASDRVQVSAAELVVITEVADGFVSLLTCEHCGHLPLTQRHRNRECACGKTRLMPASV